MTAAELADLYRGYIDCLNAQAWDDLGRFVAEDVAHNGRRFGLPGYRAMLENDFRTIPDLRFDFERIVCEPPHIACRLSFDCTPSGDFLGLAVNGRRVAFTENVFYDFSSGRVDNVWSIVDKAAIEAQLAPP